MVKIRARIWTFCRNKRSRIFIMLSLLTSLKLRFKPRPRVYMTIAIRPLSTRPTSLIFWISYYNWNFDLKPLPKPEFLIIPKSLITRTCIRLYPIQSNFIRYKPIVFDTSLIYPIQIYCIRYKPIISDTDRFYLIQTVYKLI